MRIVALEEHFATAEIIEAWKIVNPRWRDPALQASTEPHALQNLLEMGAGRLAAMDRPGIDVAVLSLTTPGVQNLDAELAVELARSANDQLASAISAHPDRLQGFVALPTPSPYIAAKELERAVLELGLQGAMLHGRTRGRNLSHAQFWPIFEAANALRAPLYLHPQSPQRGVTETYYTGFGDDLDVLFATAGIGWHYETGVQIIRMILAGVFDRFPDLQIITGHWGEVMLFFLERLDMLSKPAKLRRKISEYVQQHISVTASGMLSQRYMWWAVEVLGPDRILLATDYPFAKIQPRALASFVEAAPVNDVDRVKLASSNWDRLCAAIRR